MCVRERIREGEEGGRESECVCERERIRERGGGREREREIKCT